MAVSGRRREASPQKTLTGMFRLRCLHFLSSCIVLSPVCLLLGIFVFLSLSFSFCSFSLPPCLSVPEPLFPLCSPRTTAPDTQTPLVALGHLGREKRHVPCGCSKFCPLTCDGEEEGARWQDLCPMSREQGFWLAAGLSAALVRSLIERLRGRPQCVPLP